MAAPKVDFYPLGAADRRSRLVAACRLAEKAYEQGFKVVVRTASPAETAELDELLWTFADGAFVPHGVWPADPDVAALTPVLVGSAPLPASHRDVLINLAPDAPAEFSAYARVCDVVGGDEDGKKAGRLRWRVYREAGCVPEAHPL
ncbi:MAG TPA: DNA polymerase III subunit chi [Steroidobacteraceae bacterium]|nr:DNA polymerase III subunit chi [Steroidobacteraceae bacterium]